jgi:hypothetical protein
MVESKKKLRLEGKHKKTRQKENGRKILSDKMLSDNPMKNPDVAMKMAQTKLANNNTTANTKWIYNQKLNIRKRVKEELLEEYLISGWVLGTNLKNERNL